MFVGRIRCESRNSKGKGVKHICRSDRRRNKGLVAERDYLLNKGRAAFATFGRNALDLAAVECFARHVTNTRGVVAWLTKHDKAALSILESV